MGSMEQDLGYGRSVPHLTCCQRCLPAVGVGTGGLSVCAGFGRGGHGDAGVAGGARIAGFRAAERGICAAGVYAAVHLAGGPANAPGGVWFLAIAVALFFERGGNGRSHLHHWLAREWTENGRIHRQRLVFGRLSAGGRLVRPRPGRCAVCVFELGRVGGGGLWEEKGNTELHRGGAEGHRDKNNAGGGFVGAGLFDETEWAAVGGGGGVLFFYRRGRA